MGFFVPTLCQMVSILSIVSRNTAKTRSTRVRFNLAFLARFLFALLGHIHESLKAVFKNDVSLFMHLHAHAEIDVLCVCG